ncbi:MAG: hypothetical protein ACLFRY_02685 [Spirochaetia bacterium]
MHEEKRFDNYIRRIRKRKKELSHGGLLEELRKGFLHRLPALPEDMLEDLFLYLTRDFSEETDDYASFDEAASRLTDAADLLSEEYEDETGTLSDDDVEYIKDLVSDYALELDDNLIAYVMQKAMDRGSFG